MNHASTKALVEFLHAYLAFVGRFGDVMDFKNNEECLEFLCEYLSNPRSQRDLLTQCSIIYWKLFQLHTERKEILHASDDSIVNLCRAFVVENPIEMFKKELDLQGQVKAVPVGILSIAKLRGFILNLSRDTDILELLQETRDTALPVTFPPSC